MSLASAQVTTLKPGDIAIIGMACLFPGSPNLHAYWQNIVGKVSAIGDPPPGWAADDIFDPDSHEANRIYCRRGGFLGDLARFDPTAYGIMPHAVDGAEPEHFLALRIAHEALGDAGYLERSFNREKAGVILGRGTFLNRGNVTALQHGLVIDQTLRVLKQLHPEYGDEEIQAIRQQLKGSLPPFNTETAPGLVSNVMCGRIANRLDLQGPNYAVDAACASSMIALDLGMRELLSGRCDLMLVGGVSISTPPIVFMVFCQLGALSRSARLRPFDAEADGTLLGEGIGMVVLKRREDAERDGDRIYAVIKGVGVASDGRGLAVLAPRLEGEELALRRAYEAAGVSPSSIELIEAHGTGTPVGDLTEIQALRHVFGEREGLYPSCALGSVKSMISHTIPAAGVAGLIKAAFALYHKTLPPTLNCDHPNPKFELEKTPLYINTEARPWIHGATEPRRAGVNAFGFGGINAHVILEEHPSTDDEATPSYLGGWDTEVVILQGESRSDLIAEVERLRRYLARMPEARIADIAYTNNTQLRASTLRLAVVASSTAELDRKLAYALGRLHEPECQRIKDVNGIYCFMEPLGREGKLAYLFPGEGSQYRNMLADLCLHFPEVRRCFDRADRVFLANGRAYVPSQIVFPPPLERQIDESALWQVDCAVASVFSVNRALTTLLSRLQITPDAIVGHSSGEYAALLAAGAVEVESEEELLQHGLDLNTLYASVEDRIPAAVLVAVGAVRPGAVKAVMEQCPGPLYVTMDNCPHQVVLCGTEESARAAVEALRSRGAICSILPFKRGYHTPLFEPISEELERFFQRLRVVPPKTTLYSCKTAEPFPAQPEAIQQLAVAQWSSPVRFRETIEAMYAAGVRLFVEVGPRGNLSGFVDDILRGKPVLSVPLNVAHRSGLTQLNHALGLLAAHGVSMRPEYLYARRQLRRLPAEGAGGEVPAQRPSMPVTVVLPTARLANGGPNGAIAQHKHHRVEPAPSLATPSRLPDLAIDSAGLLAPSAVAAAGPDVSDAGRSQVMGDYLQTMERFLEVQQEIVQTFLAAAAPGVILPEPQPLTHASLDVASGLFFSAPSARILPASTLPELSDPPVPQAAPPGETGQRHDPATRFLALVSEKTGYPVEMLDLSLNMEADLGIDSIKRIEILGAFHRDTGLIRTEEMERAASLKTLQEIIDYFTQQAGELPVSAANPAPRVDEGIMSPLSPGSSAPAARALQALFAMQVVSLTPGEEVVATCTLDAQSSPFLRHHTIGGRPSAFDDSLSAMPVVPLTISLELMAEVAAILLPDKRLIGMKDVRASRWFALEDDRHGVTILAKRQHSELQDAVEVQILESNEGMSRAESGRPIIEGIMVFGEQYPVASPATALSLRDERPYGFAPEEFYRRVMFHGPLFQSVMSIDRCGEDGAQAAVRSGEATGFFHGLPASGFMIDPVLLDAAGQVVGFWTADRLQSGFVVFPIGFEALHFYEATPNTTCGTLCRARSQLLQDGRVRSDIDFVDAAERIVIRFTGWEDVRFDFPRHFVRFVLSPGEMMVSEPWPEAVDQLSPGMSLHCCRLGADRLPEALFDASSPVWQQALARLILNRQEQDAWRLLHMPENRRSEWLLGRLVVKDAVRSFLTARHGIHLCPADVEIASDQHGAPTARGPWVETVGGAPSITLAHSTGVAVALAAECGPQEGIGIDLEMVRDLSEELMGAAFSAAERDLLAGLQPAAAREWAIRFWCAKEAVGKGLGRGLSGGPLNAVIQEFDTEAGTVTITLTEHLAQALGLKIDRVFVAHTRRDGDFVVASALVRRSNQRDK